MSINLNGISRESFDFIVEKEVSSKAQYEKQYRNPERPGGQSGITVGIGYDCGYYDSATIRKDWGGKIPEAMVQALVSVCGLKGTDAQRALARVRPLVDIPWDVALDVYSNVSIPKYMSMTRKALPGYDNLPPTCKGVLLSLTYNRGASYTISVSKDPNGRYAEMRAIRAAMVAGRPDLIPAQIRSMKRLWNTPSVRGVAIRRDQEARMFEKALPAKIASLVSDEADYLSPDPTQTDEELATDDGPAPTPIPDDLPPPNFQPLPGSNGDPRIFFVRTRLKRFNIGVGVLDGKWGGVISGAIARFLNDRERSDINSPNSLEEFDASWPAIYGEIVRAAAENWHVPVSEERENLDQGVVEKVAPEVVPAQQNQQLTGWAAFAAFLAGVWASIKDYAEQAWNFVTDYKDTGIGHWITERFSSVPWTVWIFGGAGLLIVLWLNSKKTVAISTAGVKSGERV